MTYPYRILSPGLHQTADAAVAWFVKEWGVKKNRVEIEKAFDPDINFRPTFFATLDDRHLLCVDVGESIYTNTLDSVALDCLQKGLPVKLFGAVPKNVKDPDYSIKLKSAKRAGVGILEVDASSGTILLAAVSLSLAAVRPVQLAEFPARYRQALQHAHQVFRDGDPSKGCSLVYDELEAVTRRLAKKCLGKGLCTLPNNFNVDTGPWANLLREVDRTLNRADPVAKKITNTLMARLVGVTAHRNESGHKLRNVKEQIARDQTLRTRFEGAIDILKEVLDASAKWRL